MKKIFYVSASFLLGLFLVGCNNDGRLTIVEPNATTPMIMELQCPTGPDVLGDSENKVQNNGKLQTTYGYNEYSATVKTFPENVDVEYKFTSSDNGAIEFLPSTDKHIAKFKVKAGDAGQNYDKVVKLTVSMVDNTGALLSQSCQVQIQAKPKERIIPAKSLEVLNKLGEKIADAGVHEIKYSNIENLTPIIAPSNTTDKVVWEKIDGNEKITIDQAVIDGKKDWIGKVTVPVDAGPKVAKFRINVVDEKGKNRFTQVVQIQPKDNTKVSEIIVPEEIEVYAYNEEGNPEVIDRRVDVVTFPAEAFDTTLAWKTEKLADLNLTAKVDKDTHAITITGNPTKDMINKSSVINVSSKDGGVEDKKIKITVSRKQVKAKTVTITTPNDAVNGYNRPIYWNAEKVGFVDDELDKNKYLDLRAKIDTMEDNQIILWKTNNPDIAIVAGGKTKPIDAEDPKQGGTCDAKVLAIGKGEVKITAYALSNPEKALETITINIQEATSVNNLAELTYKKVQYVLSSGQPEDNHTPIASENKFILYDSAKDPGEIIISTDIEPSEATNKNIKWITLNPEVVKLTPQDDGKSVKVTPIKQGGDALIVAIPQDAEVHADSTLQTSFKGKTTLIRTASMGLQPIKVIGTPTGLKVKNTGLGLTEKDLPANHKYEIFKTELKYNLWKEVYEFAIGYYADEGSDKPYVHNERKDGGAVYKFKGAGDIGQSAGADANSSNPVTGLSWGDSINFANALTEYYNYNMNYKKGDAGYLQCVYRVSNAQNADCNRDSRSSNSTPAVVKATSGEKNGFRLPLVQEWRLAARLANKEDEATAVASLTSEYGLAGANVCTENSVNVNGKDYCLIDGALPSGVTAQQMLKVLKAKKAEDSSYETTLDGLKQETAKSVAWFAANANNQTHPVATRDPNGMGIYDMAGNSAEFTFDKPNDAVANKSFLGNKYRYRYAEIGVNHKPITDDETLTGLEGLTGLDNGNLGPFMHNPRYKIGMRFVRDLD